MQATRTHDDDAISTSESDHAQPAPPDDTRDLPELPDPSEVGEAG